MLFFWLRNQDCDSLRSRACFVQPISRRKSSASWELRDFTRFGFSSFLRHKKRTFTFSKCSFFGCGIRIATRFARVHASFSQSAVAKLGFLGTTRSHPVRVLILPQNQKNHLPNGKRFFGCGIRIRTRTE